MTMSVEEAASHRVPLGRGWSLWRWVALRSTGFPVDEVLRLADPDAAAAVDQLLDREEEEQAAREDALAACKVARAAGSDTDRSAWSKVVRAVVAGKIAPAPPSEGAAAAALRRLVAVVESRASAHEGAMRRLDAASRRTAETLRAIATDSRFREAVRWQNRQAINIVLAQLAHTGPEDRGHKIRRAESMIASYLQRYCTKNDMIGFFGPIGWAEIDSTPDGLDVTPGRELLERRQVFFEYWCIDALGSALGSDPELRLWARPRRRATIRLDGDVLYHSLDRASRLPPVFARALALCDGTMTAHKIAEQLASQEDLGLDGSNDALEVLEELAEKQFINWTFEVPNRPDELAPMLERELSSIEGPGRDRALGAVRKLEAARAEVASAAGDPERLDRALCAFDELFGELTGRDTVRNQGKTYGSRTLLYEDCRRSCEVTLSPTLLRDALGTSLPLVLASARWFTWEVARRYRSVMLDLFRALRAEASAASAPTVEYVQFFAKLTDYFSMSQQTPSPTVADVQAELRRRWMDILALDPTQHRVQLSGDALAEAVDRAFPAPAPGWPLAAFQSPDLMVAARDVDAIRRGECEFVIGEVHTGELSLFHPVSRLHHPTPEALEAARAIDVPQPIVAHVMPKDRTTRADGEHTLPGDVHVVTGSGRSWLPEGQVLAASELVLEEQEGTLCVRTRDGRHRFGVDDFFGFLLDANTTAHFHILPRLPHLPRVTIDRLVLARESWSFDPAQLSFAAAKGTDRFVGARRWARAAGLPRFVFAKVPEEVKPSFVDFESPISIDLVAKQLAKASALRVTEMLPTPEQAWLPDAEGRRYVSELRMGALDPLPWREAT